MKTFKQHLVTEAITGEVWGKLKTIEYVFDDVKNYVPLDTGLMERILKLSERIVTLHITDLVGLKQLIKLQGSKKSISTTSKLSVRHPFGGIETDGGIIVKLEGRRLLSSYTDIFSRPDEQGRRWTSVTNIFYGYVFEIKNPYVIEMDKKIEKLKEDLALQFVNNPLIKNNPEVEKYNGNNLKAATKFLSNKNTEDADLEAFRKQFAMKSIKTYMGAIRKILFTYIDKLESNILKEPIKFEVGIGYDEHIINSIKILEVLIYVSKYPESISNDKNDKYVKEVQSIVGNSVKVTVVKNLHYNVNDGDSNMVAIQDFDSPDQSKIAKFISKA